MATNHLVYGRNVLKEAIALNLRIGQVYCRSKSDIEFVNEVSGGRIPAKIGLPRSLDQQVTQGVAFEVSHDFYVNELSREKLSEYSFILLCNHLEDIQNLGAISRMAAAFGVGLVVHEERRSFSMNAAALKVSMGQAFRLHYHQVSNLAPFIKKLKDLDFIIAGLEMEGSESVYEWNPVLPLALVVGSESNGMAKPVMKLLDHRLRIPMKPDVESLNAAQAAGVTMSWIYSQCLVH